MRMFSACLIGQHIALLHCFVIINLYLAFLSSICDIFCAACVGWKRVCPAWSELCV